MAVVNIIDKEKNVLGDQALPSEIFEVEVRPELLNLVIKAHLAALRRGTVGVRTRSTVRGGGKKPWRQKGTGRARAGTIRSPLWKGGAVVHGPQSRGYDIKVNKKVKSLALKMALSSKVSEGKLVIVEDLTLDEPRTKKFIDLQRKIGIKKSLIVLAKQDNNLFLAARNIPQVKVILVSEINVYDILLYDELVLTKESIKNILERLR